MSPSMSHVMLTDVAALYCRLVWNSWAVGIEPLAPGPIRYDVVAFRGKPRACITGVEIKATRSDFLAGLRRGQFDTSKYVHEIWLAYNGDFEIEELPSHCGILCMKDEPVCQKHIFFDVCPEDCEEPKRIFYDEIRKARRMNNGKASAKIWEEYARDWTWHIATKGSTDNMNRIAANCYQYYGDD